MPREEQMRKYAGLTSRLEKESLREITLVFAEIEDAIGRPLPRSATRQGFWANRYNRIQYHGMRRAVMDAGFRGELLVDEGKVRFVKV
ncbi:DUF7662 domain-containing protein [Neorhizobium galegae]